MAFVWSSAAFAAGEVGHTMPPRHRGRGRALDAYAPTTALHPSGDGVGARVGVFPFQPVWIWPSAALVLLVAGSIGAIVVSSGNGSRGAGTQTPSSASTSERPRPLLVVASPRRQVRRCRSSSRSGRQPRCFSPARRPACPCPPARRPARRSTSPKATARRRFKSRTLRARRPGAPIPPDGQRFLQAVSRPTTPRRRRSGPRGCAVSSRRVDTSNDHSTPRRASTWTAFV